MRSNVGEQLRLTTRIDTIPVIGVVLLVLVSLIAIPPPFVHGPVLPRTVAGAPLLTHGVMLGIDREGRFYLRDDDAFELLPSPRLSARLASAYAHRTGDHVLHLLADEDASYSHVLTALDAARDAGVGRFDIITERPREGGRLQ